MRASDIGVTCADREKSWSVATEQRSSLDSAKSQSTLECNAARSEMQLGAVSQDERLTGLGGNLNADKGEMHKSLA